MAVCLTLSARLIIIGARQRLVEKSDANEATFCPVLTLLIPALIDQFLLNRHSHHVSYTTHNCSFLTFPSHFRCCREIIPKEDQE